MAETFYGVLGVPVDADSESIRRAYRERVKEHHPDVSDDPDAPAQFKRLTTARDVLTDTEERSRYDRLGHRAYVEAHVESSVWGGTEGPETSPEVSAASDEHATRTASDGGYDRTAWLGEGEPTRRRRSGHEQVQTASATATAEEWQHASSAYRRADTDVGRRQHSPVRSLLAVVRSVGPWLFVHLVFVGSAVVTSWLAFSQLASHVTVSWPTLLFGVLLVAGAVFASVLHVIAQCYS